ncbi:MAG: hypothetical protein IPG96_11535 [Proteobacteria bacterium]|nr:hypothetical protein [Pseudomonadota bacterium]
MRAVLGGALGLLLLACSDYPEVVGGDPCLSLSGVEQAARGCFGLPGYGRGRDTSDPPTAAEIVGRCATGEGRVDLAPGVRLRSAIVISHGCSSDPFVGGMSTLIAGRTYRVAEIDGAVALVREDAEATVDLLVGRDPKPPFLRAPVSAGRALEAVQEAWRADYLEVSELTIGSVSAVGPCITAEIDGQFLVSPSRAPRGLNDYPFPLGAFPYACDVTGTLLIAPLAEQPLLADDAGSRTADGGLLPARRVDGGDPVCPRPSGRDGGAGRMLPGDAAAAACTCGETSSCRP